MQYHEWIEDFVERPVRTVLSRWTKVLLNIHVVQYHEWIEDFVERPVRTVLSRWTKVLLKDPGRALPTNGPEVLTA